MPIQLTSLGMAGTVTESHFPSAPLPGAESHSGREISRLGSFAAHREEPQVIVDDVRVGDEVRADRGDPK